MPHTDFFLEAFDGRKMFFNQWIAGEDAVASIALVHGLGEHSGRYEHVAAYFNSHKINVVAVDLFGHGKTEGKKGHTPQMDDYLWQIDFLIDLTQKLAPGLPVFLYGHSMGGCLVLNHLYKKQPKIAGLIASAPAVQPGFKVPALKLLIGKIGRKLAPGLIQKNGLDLGNLSHDPTVAEKYIADPLVHDLLSAELGMGILEYGNWLETHETKSQVPVLMMHGTDDKLTNFAASKAFSEKAKGNITFKPWPGMYHEIHNETDKQKVFEYTLDWIKKII
jgi:alpha-beta hydrolase superfamily lysophospholipase